MTSILFVIVRIYRNQFKYNYLRNEKVFLNFCCLSETLGLLVNTFTLDDKYSLSNRENSPQPIQMRLYKKQRTFSQIFARLL